MNKRMTIMISALGIVFGGIIGFNLFKSFMIKRFFASYEPPPVSVSSVTAVQRNWQPHLSAVGNFVAINGVDVNSETSGNVVKIHFESGQYLEEGSPLIDIDDRVDQATLKFNQAELSLRQLNYKRQADLFKRGATSSSVVDEATASLQQSQANVERTEAEIKKKHIVAPFSGLLGIRQVNLGQYVTPGQTAIVTLQSLDPLYLEFHLPEQLLKRIHINQGIQFSVEEFPNTLFEGKITAINSKVDTNTHNILVQATLPNCPFDAINSMRESDLIKVRKQVDGEKKIISCDSRLNSANHITRFAFIPGMFSSIAIEQPHIPDVVVLPSTAISYSLYGNSVFVIEKKGKDKNDKDILKVKRVFVSTGEQEGNYTIIKKGITNGQQVVSSGELKLQNGTRVVINNSVKLDEVVKPESLGQ
ncbi:acriflavin resistance protein E [Legionella nautarum]|uniref:Acriflavin resistance protein E n=1 Tax=Legionella nautarum TaxID=45070 RepID=A0A0W0WTQ2_9GAMM|nr:efflux RND transporter periplasmic adaptor subunit [Legionella nautarum]KTD35713.1 acriflavin resistance protein E [Legionella nautarum]